MEIDRRDTMDTSGEPSGTHTPANEGRCWMRQQFVSGGVTDERWGGRDDPVITELTQLVRDLNIQKLEPIDAEKFRAKCPFKLGCSATGA